MLDGRSGLTNAADSGVGFPLKLLIVYFPQLLVVVIQNIRSIHSSTSYMCVYSIYHVHIYTIGTHVVDVKPLNDFNLVFARCWQHLGTKCCRNSRHRKYSLFFVIFPPSTKTLLNACCSISSTTTRRKNALKNIVCPTQLY